MLGVSVFLCNLVGEVFYIYLVYVCGFDILFIIYIFFDLMFKGCNEDVIMDWLCYYDCYDEVLKSVCCYVQVSY